MPCYAMLRYATLRYAIRVLDSLRRYAQYVYAGRHPMSSVNSGYVKGMCACGVWTMFVDL